MPTQSRSYIPKFRLWNPEAITTTAMPTAPRDSSAPPAQPCDWRGDLPEPELDDLAYQHTPKPRRQPHDSCDWQGDPTEEHTDDLAYQHKPEPKPEPKPALQSSPQTPEAATTAQAPPTVAVGMSSCKAAGLLGIQID